MADSFWLAEAAPTLRSQPLSGPADVEIVGGGITGCSAALTLARPGQARAPARGARGRLRRERPQRRLRPARRGDGIRQRACVARPRCRCGLLAPDGGLRRPDGRARRRRVPPDGQPPARRRTRSATSCGRSTRRCARTASRPSGATSFPSLSPAAFQGRSSIRTTPSCSRRGSSGGSRSRRRRPASRSASTTGSRTWTSSRPRPSSSRPTATRAACSASSRG